MLGCYGGGRQLFTEIKLIVSKQPTVYHFTAVGKLTAALQVGSRFLCPFGKVLLLGYYWPGVAALGLRSTEEEFPGLTNQEVPCSA